MVDLRGIRSIHVVGAGGAGMSAIGTILASMGIRVSGSDLKDSAALRRLEAAGATIAVGHAASLVGDVDALAISTAVPAANPEVRAARERGIPVLRRAEILSAICALRPTVAVAGTHGKTTTSAMLSLILVEAGMHPSFLVGGELNEVGGGAAWDASVGDAPFVVEADESDGTFVELGAHAVLVTNVEPDHLEFWGGMAALRDAFRRFVEAAPGPRVIGVDDAGARALAESVSPVITFGSSAAADWRMTDYTPARVGSSFDAVVDGSLVGHVALAVPGRHNASNALAALAMAASLGAPVDAAIRALGRYAGVARRWEFRGSANGITFVDEYSHLPTEIAAALATARDGGWERIVAVFQPHRYSRTETLWPTFADAFVDADVVVVTDIYPADEAPRPGITGKLIVDAVLDAHPAARVAWLPGRRDLVSYLVGFLRPGDICLTLGAGDLTSLPDEVMERL